MLLGALLADVPHTRPVRVTGGAGNPELAALAGVEPSYYEGPTGIVGVVADALGRAGIATTSLWASVPHYVSQSSSPKATLALVERCARVLGTEVDVAKLRISAAAYERQINELVASDEDASAYVTAPRGAGRRGAGRGGGAGSRRGRGPAHSRLRRGFGGRGRALPEGTPQRLRAGVAGRRRLVGACTSGPSCPALLPFTVW